MNNSTSPWVALALCVALSALATGCAGSGPPTKSIVRAPGLAQVRYVIVMPLENETEYEGETAWIRRAVCEQIAKSNLFDNMVLLRPEDERLVSVVMPARAAAGLEEMAYLHRTYGADAVLQGVLTSYRVYPRPAIGLCMRIIDLKTGEVLFFLDSLWDGNDKTTVKRIQAYYRDILRENDIPYDWEVVLVSPKLYSYYVGNEVARILADKKKSDS